MDASLHIRSTVASYRALLTDLTEMGYPPGTMREAAAQGGFAGRTGLRHDTDYRLGRSLMMGRIEQEMGVRSTYYLLHAGHDGHVDTYYGRLRGGRIEHRPQLFEAARMLVEMGHEVGLHNDFLYLSMLTGRPAAELVAEEIQAFAAEGVQVVGSASHGSKFSRRHNFVNYELFAQCPRSEAAVYVDRDDPVEAGREIVEGAFRAHLNDVDMVAAGLSYEAYFVGPCLYVMDAGGEVTLRWFDRGAPVVETAPILNRAVLENALERSGAPGVQLLVHADHWTFSGMENDAAALRRRVSRAGAAPFEEVPGHILPTQAAVAPLAALSGDAGVRLTTASGLSRPAPPDVCEIVVILVAGGDPAAVDRMTAALVEADVPYTLVAPARWHAHTWGDVQPYPLDWTRVSDDAARGKAEVVYLYNALLLADGDIGAAHDGYRADLDRLRERGIHCAAMAHPPGARSPAMPSVEAELWGDVDPLPVMPLAGEGPFDAAYSDARLPRAAAIKADLDPVAWLKANRAPGRRLAMILHPHHYGPSLLLADAKTPRWMLNVRARHAPPTET